MSSEDSPRTVVMGLLNGAWIAQAVSTATRFNVPDLVAEHGPLSAAQLVEAHGVDARVDLLQRLLRACAAAGVFSEDAEGRFGPTERSAVLSRSSRTSVKHFAELYGGDWWQSWGRLHQVVLHMMVDLPGKERTEDEWRRLFHSTGFALERIVHPDPRRGASLIEGVRTRD